MKNSFIDDQVEMLQNEFCTVLKSSLNRINIDDFWMIIDEINLFWYSNRDVIKLILNYIAYDSECYTFTGASFLDVSDNEHFPFTTLGEIHVVDDPLHRYLSAPKDIQNEEYNLKLKEEIINTIKDNIKIIEEYSSIILILPVTVLSDINKDLINSATDQAFFSMFKDDLMSPEKYFDKFDKIEDVANSLNSDAVNTIIFSANDDDIEGLDKRFKNFLSQGHMFENQISEARLFYFTIRGFFAQAFNILLTCTQYNMIPYLRYDVIFRYTMMLGSNFIGNEKMKKVLFKIACAHLLYKIFDKGKISNVNYIDYLNCIKKKRISDKINEKIQKNEIDVNKYSVKEVIEFLENELNKVYEYVNESD